MARAQYLVPLFVDYFTAHVTVQRRSKALTREVVLLGHLLQKPENFHNTRTLCSLTLLCPPLGS